MTSRLSGSSAHPRVLALFAALVATAAAPDGISTIASAANLTLHNVNLPVFASTANRVVMNGEATRNARPGNVLDCSRRSSTSPASTNRIRSARHGRRRCNDDAMTSILR